VYFTQEILVEIETPTQMHMIGRRMRASSPVLLPSSILTQISPDSGLSSLQRKIRRLFQSVVTHILFFLF